MTASIALIGAGGKMGCRITDNLKHYAHPVYYVEISERGVENLAERGLAPTAQEAAVPLADVIILAVPDVAIESVSKSIVPMMKSGAMLMLLDPAAAYSGKLPERADVTYFVTHPCHPPVFNDETGDARRDYFGGVKAKQAIVCALMQGTESDYERGEQIARTIFAPVMRAHRITLEQMAMLEPTMAETIGAMLIVFSGEVLEEAVRRGVPREAARDFMPGHLNISLAIVFGEAGNPFSDACQIAIEYGKKAVIRDDWRSLFEPDNVRGQIDIMLHPEKLGKLAR
jgi:Prephenate dehydrogenase